MAYDKKDIIRRMEGAVSAFRTELKGLRAGRATVNLLDGVSVTVYGSSQPLNQVGSVSVSDARTLVVNVWDKEVIAAVNKAIRDAGLGLNPVVDGQMVRVPVPPLNEERRIEMTRIAGKYAESARIAVRNIRRDSLDTLKKMEKAADISKNELRSLSGAVQQLTDSHIVKIDETLQVKEAEIKQV